jgi:hypothetical protein
VLLATLALTLTIELVTCFCRFGLRLSSRRVQRHWPLRIHHAYLGIPFVLLGTWPALGWALILSDALHHFAVLPLTAGSTELP